MFFLPSLGVWHPFNLPYSARKILLDLSCLDPSLRHNTLENSRWCVRSHPDFPQLRAYWPQHEQENIGRLPLLLIKHFILSLDFQYLENSRIASARNAGYHFPSIWRFRWCFVARVALGAHSAVRQLAENLHRSRQLYVQSKKVISTWRSLKLALRKLFPSNKSSGINRGKQDN